eukprot:15448694-Alexandrium_andersonii.AAC.1
MVERHRRCCFQVGQSAFASKCSPDQSPEGMLHASFEDAPDPPCAGIGGTPLTNSAWVSEGPGALGRN